MKKNLKYRLTGGVFFGLVLKARKFRTQPRKPACGETDKLSESDVMVRLIQILQPTWCGFDKQNSSSFGTAINSYKTFKNAKSVFFPFLEDDTKRKFTKNLKENYEKMLNSMESFVSLSLDFEEKCTDLVKELLDLIERDETILDSQEFYIERDGQTVKKEDIKKMVTFNFAAFY
ncbi:MAG: hypothetical protein R3Y63_04810 [Eubacteriales bacterium]